MPYSAGPNIAARSSLVFEYDLGDVQNSYKGEPTTNLYPYSEQVNQWANSNCVVTANATIAPDGTVTADFLKADGVATYHTVYQIISTTSGLTYTFSCYVKPAGGFNGNTNTFFMQTNDGSWKNITFNLSNLTYSATAGTSGFVQASASGWYRVGWTVTIATGGSLYWYIYPTSSPSAETVGGGYYVWGAQLEQKDHVTQYLPTPAGASVTRSSTQGLLDVSGQNNTINLASVSFTSAAQPTFDGTDDSMVVTNSDSFKNVNITVETVIKFNTFKSADLVQFGVGSGTYAQWYFRDYGDGRFNWFQSVPAIASYTSLEVSRSSLVTGRYYHIVCTASNGSSSSMYYNGALAGSTGATGGTGYSWTPANMTIGGFSWDGYSNTDIPLVRIYSQALSASEILRNYNQLKTRFNLL